MMVTPRSRMSRTRPHMSRRSSTSTPAGRLVQEQDFRLVGQRLGDHHPALHAAGERHDLRVLAFSHRDRSRSTFSTSAGIRRAAEQAAAEAGGRPDGLEGIRRELLRHEADLRARGLVVPEDVVAVGRSPCPRSG